ncbi:MAG TPA: Crp/Fnr family transcriptional regulator [Polyangiaceae bacterium]|nr:Crp/Fnr family transcriptional regulator [Polyangiaceae bacterium]
MDEADRAPRSQPRADDIEPQERARLLGRYGRRFFSGDAIHQEGAAATEAFLLQEGRVRLLKRVAMADRSLGVVRTGDLFGEDALLVESTTYGSTAIALTAGVVLALDRATFRALLKTHPQLGSQAIEQLATRLRAAEDQIEIMMLRSVESRVTSVLIKLAGPTSGAAEITISPVELSSRVGLDVEAVKRTVQRMRDREYLRITGERIEIPDVEALRRLHSLLGAKDELAGES